jgi:hypothetical protein
MSSRFRKIAIATAFLAVILGVSTYAYYASLSPQAGPKVTVTSPPLQFSMQIDKTEYNMGENISIMFWLNNTSNETLKVEYANTPILEPFIPFKRFDFVVSNESGELYDDATQHSWKSNGTFELGRYYFYTLNPGEEIIETNFWDQKDLLMNQVPAGMYYLRGVIPVWEVSFRINGGPWIKLETPSLSFIIK